MTSVPPSQPATRRCSVTWRLYQDPQIAASMDLRQAFRSYADALLLAAPARPDRSAQACRAQRMLVADVSVGAHEQMVADPFIKAAIPGGSILAVVATSHLGLHLPDGVVQLDEDVPRPTYLDGRDFPTDLQTLHDPELIELADRFGQDHDSVVHSDAPDWESYHERMGYIFTLLRAYQCDVALFELPPGTPGGE